jgi:HSP20 family protein
MDRLFDRFTSGLGVLPFPGFRADSTFGIPFPAVDITEDEKSFKLSAELPGMAEKDIEVSLAGNTLVIKGRKEEEKQQKEKGYYLSERSYGEFSARSSCRTAPMRQDRGRRRQGRADRDGAKDRSSSGEED